MVLGYHIVLMGYGHWLPNDPRGSYSQDAFSPDLHPLAEVHFGRKRVQPSREELRAFLREAQQRLKHRTLWWELAQRQALRDAFGGVIRAKRLTCYAAAVLQNHAHLLIRRHAMRVEPIWELLREAGRAAIIDAGHAPSDHPVLSGGGCHRFKSTEAEMWDCVEYVNGNFAKHGVPFERYPFVTMYDGWPTRGVRRP